jgi:hypothetical protein
MVIISALSLRLSGRAIMTCVHVSLEAFRGYAELHLRIGGIFPANENGERDISGELKRWETTLA